MRFSDFFERVPQPENPWGPSYTTTTVRMDLVRRLAEGPASGDDALATAVALVQLGRGQFQFYGTDGKQQICDEESREALRSLRAVLRRHAVDFAPGWSDFSSFREAGWCRNPRSNRAGTRPHTSSHLQRRRSHARQPATGQLCRGLAYRAGSAQDIVDPTPASRWDTMAVTLGHHRVMDMPVNVLLA
ncbi:hypothetical protein Xcel_0856 [Xylanimonas cellulosilytica DSM 15894]|uniref:Uncharacterized protein n=1 Tax=Xylanimonas cellulosilytica (strain DSM 15894 / JCM 12276 / CECT 5975 / KCTC 9989 / LMG 20990 / NBRC 107835 / XIL07) TaxID=446471 RepID=D1BY46_XYLCX|nr:hypothetical protein Xcel_0856 [Xylanimonas cellulosilytica DSM 15894]